MKKLYLRSFGEKQVLIHISVPVFTSSEGKKKCKSYLVSCPYYCQKPTRSLAAFVQSKTLVTMAGVTGDVTSKATGFHTRQDGFLYCDDVKISELHQQLRTSQESLPTSPVFVYSRRQLEKNVRQFREALSTLPVPATLNFAMKSNHNLQVKQ